MALCPLQALLLGYVTVLVVSGMNVHRAGFHTQYHVSRMITPYHSTPSGIKLYKLLTNIASIDVYENVDEWMI